MFRPSSVIVVGLLVAIFAVQMFQAVGIVDSARSGEVRRLSSTQSDGRVPSTQPVEDWVYHIYGNDRSYPTIVRSLFNVSLAGAVGFLGASAYFVGVVTGFIDPTSREEVLLHLLNDTTQKPPSRRWLLRVYFFVFGGVVAAVFQAAQGETFAPIQAFVLGITWPSVVSRSMSTPNGGRTIGDALQPGGNPPTTGPDKGQNSASGAAVAPGTASVPSSEVLI